MINIAGKRFKIIVKPNSKENKVEEYDKDKNAYRISIKARAEDNKANIEIVKFLSKTLKKRVRIVSGLKSKEKVIEVFQ
ncbi:DUF167 domain-containing protein [Candidatus Woesearchaeota archaeon]|nr:DUF167 domain-containing protein [Candidatus Woesearchaeota archaeon]